MSIIQEIKNDLHSMDQNRSAMRLFGLLLAGLLLAMAGVIYFWSYSETTGTPVKLIVLSGLGLLSGLAAAIIPEALRPVNTVFLIISLIIGWIMTRLVLIILFFGLFFPVGVILRLMGKDSMRLKLDRQNESYWILRSEDEFDPARCRRLF
ncbi:hypothetical protein JW823_07805 [bacterium]|nr:hypothetical protein [candidate division CSSED10-310 bacterium]